MKNLSIEPAELLASLQSAHAALLLDVRKATAFEASPIMLAGAVRCSPDDVPNWQSSTGQEVVVYCVYGHHVSHTAAEQLRARGIPARYLAGGLLGGEDGEDSPQDIARWRATALPKIDK